MKAKNLIALLSAAAVCAAVPCSAYAAGQDTVLTAEVESSYLLSIPKNQTIPYGAENTDIGVIQVTGNLRPSTAVEVSVSKTSFENTESDSAFSFDIYSNGSSFTSVQWSSEEVAAKTAKAVPLAIHIPRETWNAADAGTYQAIVTFTAALRQR